MLGPWQQAQAHTGQARRHSHTTLHQLKRVAARGRQQRRGPCGGCHHGRAALHAENQGVPLRPGPAGRRRQAASSAADEAGGRRWSAGSGGVVCGIPHKRPCPGSQRRGDATPPSVVGTRMAGAICCTCKARHPPGRPQRAAEPAAVDERQQERVAGGAGPGRSRSSGGGVRSGGRALLPSGGGGGSAAVQLQKQELSLHLQHEAGRGAMVSSSRVESECASHGMVQVKAEVCQMASETCSLPSPRTGT